MTSPLRAIVGANKRMLDEVRDGFARPQKELPPKYFYDRRGSELFEEITRLPEYYLTRTERGLLTAWMPELIGRLGTRTLVELGAGSAEKTRIILDAMRAHGTLDVYVPIDVSAAFLQATARRLVRQYATLHVRPLVADISEPLHLPSALPSPAIIAFLGSTIGNFAPAEAVALLRHVRDAMRPGDAFLLATDLVKDVAIIERAYNDSRGVTAEFNRNMLHVLNAELGADFVPDRFAHRAFFARDSHRIEMHLVASEAQTVSIPGIGDVSFARGESIRTEISCKYDRARVNEMLVAAGLELADWRTDADGGYAMAVARRA